MIKKTFGEALQEKFKRGKQGRKKVIKWGETYMRVLGTFYTLVNPEPVNEQK